MKNSQMNIIDKHKCINNYTEHQNSLSDSLYYEPVSKDPRGPEGPQATSEVIDNSEKILKSKNSDIFKISKHIVQITIK